MAPSIEKKKMCFTVNKTSKFFGGNHLIEQITTISPVEFAKNRKFLLNFALFLENSENGFLASLPACIDSIRKTAQAVSYAAKKLSLQIHLSVFSILKESNTVLIATINPENSRTAAAEAAVLSAINSSSPFTNPAWTAN